MNVNMNVCLLRPYLDVKLPTYPLGIRPNVVLPEPRTSVCIPQKGLFKGCNVVRLKVEEEGDKGSRP